MSGYHGSAAPSPPTTEDLVAAIQEITVNGADVSIDTSGNDFMMTNALRCLKFHGTFLPVAPFGVIESFDMGGDVMMPMRTVKGSCEGESDPKTFIPQMVRWYKEGRFPTDKTVTSYEFPHIDETFEGLRKKEAIKAVMRVSEQ